VHIRYTTDYKLNINENETNRLIQTEKFFNDPESSECKLKWKVIDDSLQEAAIITYFCYFHFNQMHQLSVIKIYSANTNFVLKWNRRRDQIKVLVAHVAAEVVCLEL